METKEETHERTGMPRWVKVFLIVVAVLALALVVTKLAGIQHGPSLHTPPGGPEPQRPSPSPGEHTPFMEHGP